MPEKRLLNYRGEQRPIGDLAIEAGINYQTLRSRLKKGWSVERALETPAKPLGEASRVHGQTGSKEYKAWLSMKRRCSDPGRHNAHRYVGRGISVCAEWKQSFQAFFDHVGPAPSRHHSLGRIDNDGNYERNNVEWQSASEQARNRGGYYEERRRLKESSNSVA